MKIWAALHGAWAGWLKILRGDPGWRDHFRLSAAGLATALVLFYIIAFLSVVLNSLQQDLATTEGLLATMLVQSLWLVALVLALLLTRSTLRDKSALLPVLVPGIYAIIVYLVLGTLVTMLFSPLLPLLWLPLGYMLFRLGRVGGNWNTGVSAAFAVLTLVLLVGLPMTLYMLTAPAISA